MAALKDIAPMVQSLLTRQPSTESVFKDPNPYAYRTGQQQLLPSEQGGIPQPPNSGQSGIISTQSGPGVPPQPTGPKDPNAMPEWTSWGMPLISALGGALSTPRIGSGPERYIGNALSGGANTYMLMNQLENKRLTAALRQKMLERQQQATEQHQRNMETLGLGRLNESQKYHADDLTVRKQLSGETVTAGQFKRDNPKPVNASTPTERKINAARKEYGGYLHQQWEVKNGALTPEQFVNAHPEAVAQAQAIAKKYGIPIEDILGSTPNAPSGKQSMVDGGGGGTQVIPGVGETVQMEGLPPIRRIE